MKTAKQLREERAVLIEKMQALHKKAGDEKRDLSQDEQNDWNNLNTQVDENKKLLVIAERQESLDAETVAIRSAHNGGSQALSDGVSKQDKKDLSKYSLVKVMRSIAYNEPLQGLEREMHEEAQREALASGVQITGTGIPSVVLTQQRDNSITMPTQPEDGGLLVQKEVRGVLELLRARLVLRQLGAQFLTGLTGNIVFPEQTQGAVSTWKPEVAALDKSNVKFASREFAPKRLGTYMDVSKQFLIQTAPAIEAMLRQELADSQARAIDIAGVAGTGANNQPTGILTAAGVPTVSLGANGAAPTRNALVAMYAALDNANIPLTDLAFLTNPLVAAKLQTTILDAGSGRFLMEDLNSLNNFRAVTSTAVPSNLTKGTGTGLSAIIFGNWNDLLIGQWGGLDLTVDPYTLALQGQIRMIVQGFYDVFIRRVTSFVKIVDANTTI